MKWFRKNPLWHKAGDYEQLCTSVWKLIAVTDCTWQPVDFVLRQMPAEKSWDDSMDLRHCQQKRISFNVWVLWFGALALQLFESMFSSKSVQGSAPVAEAEIFPGKLSLSQWSSVSDRWSFFPTTVSFLFGLSWLLTFANFEHCPFPNVMKDGKAFFENQGNNSLVKKSCAKDGMLLLSGDFNAQMFAASAWK